MAGMGLMIHYDTGPGAQGAAPERWPKESAVQPSGLLPQLIMFAHPRCPCTRASIEELARIMTQGAGRVDARVLFYAPEAYDDFWWKTDLFECAMRVHGVDVGIDLNGDEARRFGVMTSGHTVLFDPNGQLLFSGGITESRGHAGDNVGRSVVTSHLTGRAPLVSGAQDCNQCAVYGCLLFPEESS